MNPSSSRSAGPSFPARVGRYELLLPLGSGGMARVYLAREEGLRGFERDVALKLMHPHLRDQGRWAEELLEEAKLTAKIRDHHVVPVLDVGDDPEGMFLVMEYVEGDALSEVLRAGEGAGRPIPAPVAVKILSDALAGLHAAHMLTGEDGHPLGVVHRDVSPQNILVGIDGVARLTDFGIAKARSRIGFTGTGLIKGKIGYLSPEQARGGAVDLRSDVWSAAIVAWEVLAGRRMFSSGDEMATLLRITSETPPRLSSVRPGTGAELDEVLAVALERDRERRWPTVQEMRSRLLGAFGPIADTSEVAEYVRDVLRVRLAERHDRADRARKDRIADAPTERVFYPEPVAVSEPLVASPRAPPDSASASTVEGATSGTVARTGPIFRRLAVGVVLVAAGSWLGASVLPGVLRPRPEATRTPSIIAAPTAATASSSPPAPATTITDDERVQGASVDESAASAGATSAPRHVATRKARPPPAPHPKAPPAGTGSAGAHSELPPPLDNPYSPGP